MFRFTIRDVLWLTVVVALVIAWRFEVGRARDRERMREMQLELLSGVLERDGYKITIREDGMSFKKTRFDGDQRQP